ncbi:MAG: type III polyketide synthase [Salinarimonas sp.]|nr:type III polyketide synthase [Salinarimonas sp.]
MSRKAAILGIATAVPPYQFTQEDALSAARDILAPRFAGFARLESVFTNAAIDKRHAVMPIDWYREPRGWRDRSHVFLEKATELFIEAANGALQHAGFAAREVDTIVTVSSTGIATPGLEARALITMGFREDVRRVPVFGLGCAGGASGLTLAARLAEAAPWEKVLLVVVETCTLAFRSLAPNKADIVASALFGDGAAACLLRAGEEGSAGVRVVGSAEHTWPDTLDIMGWDIGEEGLGVIFSQAIPGFARAHLPDALARILAGWGVARETIVDYVLHPGGAKVIDALEDALMLESGSLQREREVLRGYGNMSAPTVLFVLERAVKAGLRGPTLLGALGPGFTLSCALMEPAR